MIKNGRKHKIEDLYSPFRCEEMPETADRIDGWTAVSDIISHRNGNYRSFILFFFIILYHLLDCKMVYDRFRFFFFFFFFYENSLSLTQPVRIQNGSLISVI